MAAPWASMAICGTPSGTPAPLIGWQMISRHPSKLGCLRVATMLPSTRAKSIGEPAPHALARIRYLDFVLLSSFVIRHSGLINAQVVHHHTAADAREGARVRQAFTGRRGDDLTEIGRAH